MGWEWAAPAAGALVGIAGIVGGWRIAVAGRRHEERMAEQRYVHERVSAHEQWHRDRVAGAYLDLLELAEAVGDWIAGVLPMWDTDPSQPLPDLPSVEAQQRVWAGVAAFGSDDVKDTLEVWRVASLGATETARAVSREDYGARQQLNHLRAAERDARVALGKQIASELRVDG